MVVVGGATVPAATEGQVAPDSCDSGATVAGGLGS